MIYSEKVLGAHSLNGGLRFLLTVQAVYGIYTVNTSRDMLLLHSWGFTLCHMEVEMTVHPSPPVGQRLSADNESKTRVHLKTQTKQTSPGQWNCMRDRLTVRFNGMEWKYERQAQV